MATKVYVPVDWRKFREVPAEKKLAALRDVLTDEAKKITDYLETATAGLGVAERLRAMGQGDAAETIMQAILHASPVDVEQTVAERLGCLDEETLRRVDAQLAAQRIEAE